MAVEISYKQIHDLQQVTDPVVSATAAGLSAEIVNRVSVSAVLKSDINAVSNNLSVEIGNRTSVDLVIANNVSVVSNALSVEIANRVSAEAVLSNNISVVSAFAAAIPSANAVSAQLVSVSAVLKGDIDTVSNNLSVAQTNINTVSNNLSNEISNRISMVNVVSNAVSVVSVAINVVSNAVSVVSNSLSIETANRISASTVLQGGINTVSNNLSNEISNRVSADALLSQNVSVISQQVSVISQQVSVLSAKVVSAMVVRAINTGAQASISVSTCITVSGVSLPVVAGVNYRFQFVIPFTHGVLTGITIGVTGPATTNFVARTQVPTTGTANATTYGFGLIPTIGGKVSTISNALSGVTQWAMIDGYVNPSAPGSLHCIIGPTVQAAQANVVVLKGAMGMLWKMS